MRALLAAMLLMTALRAQTPGEGQKIFAKNCSFCHGPDASGGAEGPNLILSGTVRHDKAGELIGQVVREGRPAKGMPAFGSLSDAQIADIAAFLHARVKESDLRSPKRPKDYALKLLLTGDARQGKQFFDEHCTACHSASGDLKGVAAKYDPATLQGRLLLPEGVDKTAIVQLGSAIYKGTLLYMDPFTVEIRDEAGEYHSWDPKRVKVSIQDPLAGHLKLLPQYSEADMHNAFAYLETLR